MCKANKTDSLIEHWASLEIAHHQDSGSTIIRTVDIEKASQNCWPL